MYTFVSSLLGLSLILPFVASQGTISLSPSAALPTGSSQILSPSFAGFGIEPTNLFSFTGGEQANDLSINLLQNLADYTGTPPHLRIGGNTQDNIIYNANYGGWSVEMNPDSVAPNGAFKPDEFIVGPKFFMALNRFPKGTPITFGLNLAYEQSDYLSKITTHANAAREQLTNLDVTGYEIGNEPDLYLQNGFRTGQWDGSVYTQQWLTRANAINNQVLHPNGLPSNMFEPGATASTIGTSFQIMDLVQDGITVDANSSSKPYVAGFNQHDYYYYIGVSTYALSFQLFTDLTTTSNQFAAWTNQLTQAYDAGYPYYLREMGVVGPIGLAGITDTFAASLWTMNFFLYAATLNISSVQMHMTDNSNASAWQPIPYPAYSPEAFVRPNYYAWPAVTQIISADCSTQVAALPISTLPSGYTAGNLVAYSYYKQGSLAGVTIINTQIANVSDTSKNSVTINLSLPNYAGKTMYLSYLTSQGADAKHQTTWNSTSYESSGDGTPTSSPDGLTHTASIGSDGSVSFTVRDSQAVVANIGYFAGTGGANTTACAALAATQPDAAQSTTTQNSQSGSGTGSGGSSSSSSAATSFAASSIFSTSAPTPTSSSAAALRTLFTALPAFIIMLIFCL